MKEKNDVLKEVAVELDRFKKKLALAIKEQSEKGNYSSNTMRLKASSVGLEKQINKINAR